MYTLLPFLFTVMRCVICKRFCFLYFTSIPHPTDVAVSMLTTEIVPSKVSNYPLLTILSLLGLPVAFNVHKQVFSLEIFILFASVLLFIPTLCILWILAPWSHPWLDSPLSHLQFLWQFLQPATLLSLLPLHLLSLDGLWMVQSSSTTQDEESESSLSPPEWSLLLKESHHLSSFDFIKYTQKLLIICSLLLHVTLFLLQAIFC